MCLANHICDRRDARAAPGSAAGQTMPGATRKLGQPSVSSTVPAVKALVVGVLALFAFSACSDNQSDAKVDFEFVVDLSSRQTDARRFDRDGQATTGALVLDGKGRGTAGDVGVVVWGLFNYRNAAGEFAISVELDFGDGNTLYAYANAGRTTVSDAGAHLEATLAIVGGTGKFEGRRGEVTWAADRAVTVGSPLVATFRGRFDAD